MGVIPCQFDSDLSNLERQLLVKEAPSTEGALLVYGVWREDQHDDLVLATAVACWYGERQPGYGV